MAQPLPLHHNNMNCCRELTRCRGKVFKYNALKVRITFNSNLVVTQLPANHKSQNIILKVELFQ